MSEDLRTIRRFCRRFDGKRVGPHLATDAQLDWFGRRVVGRRQIEEFVRGLGTTLHELDAAGARPPPQPEEDVEGDVMPLEGSGMGADDGAERTGAPAWDSDDDGQQEAVAAPSPPGPLPGLPRTPDNPIPRDWTPRAQVVNAPRAKRRRRLHLETAEKAGEMAGVLGDALWSEAVGKLYLQRRRDHDDDDEVTASVKNFKLRLGATSTSREASVVGIVYFDNMSCRKKLSFVGPDWADPVPACDTHL